MGKQQLTTETFIERADIVHKGKYKYHNTIYTKAHDYVTVTCEIHGDFRIKAYSHLNGRGCKLCAIEEKANKRRGNTESFIKQSKEIFGEDTFIYTETVYGKNNKEKVKIICPKHGAFYITPLNHIVNKIGCPHCACKSSKYEQEIYDILRSKLPQEIEIIKKDRTILKTQEVDILIPSLKIGIEFDGIRWHSEKFGHKNQAYHLNKTVNCNNQGISLIHVFENEYIENKELALSRILHKCRLSNKEKISARKCTITYLDPSDDRVKEFIKRNTFSDEFKTPYNRVLVAFYKDMIVGIISYKIIENKAFVSHLMASHEYRCIGLASKLLKSLKNAENNISSISIFTDRRWVLDINNNSLTKLGFKIKKILPPRKLYYNPSVNQEKLFLMKPQENEININLKQHETDIVRDCGIIEYEKNL